MFKFGEELIQNDKRHDEYNSCALLECVFIEYVSVYVFTHHFVISRYEALAQCRKP